MTSETPIRERPALDDWDAQVLERSNNVLWSLSPTGIVLHNVVSRTFLELDEMGYRVWGLLDGARSAGHVIKYLAEEGSAPSKSLRRKLRDVIQTLATYGFVGTRQDE